MFEWDTIIEGGCEQVLASFPDNSIDLIFTSPPYADQRRRTYGGVSPDEYVEWFLPKTQQFLRVLKPTGTFVLNIKERVVNGERHTYVIELILNMRKQGWLWTEEFMWHKKKTCTRGNGPIDCAIRGSVYYSSIKRAASACTETQLWFLWAIGRRTDWRN